jgi:hypothetical protein
VYRVDFVVEGELEESLLRGARAARRMGARLTRYDAETSTVEARLVRFKVPLVLRLHGEDAGRGRTRLAIESWRARGASSPDFGLARLTIARFRAVLAMTDAPDPHRR